MSKAARRFLVPAFVFAFGWLASSAEAKRVDGVFTNVEEADVVVLDYGSGSYTVRLFGVAAPATGQPFAAEAKQFVRERLLGREGAMRFRYRNAAGEMVSRIFYRASSNPKGGERDLATDLVAAGLAWVRPGAKYRPEQPGQVDRLTAALAEAKAARRGIWSLANPVEPWTFRNEKPERDLEPTGLSLGVAGNPDINVSKLSGDENECAIAKNPNDPQQLVVHCNSPDNPWRSTDGGQTWVAGGAIGSYCCDPNLAWDSFGNLYATYINGGVDAIVTKLSTDGGATFSDLASFGGGGVDQPSVVATDLPDDGEGNPQVALWIVLNQGGMKARGALVTGLGVANVGAFGPLQSIATGASPCSFGDLTVSPTGVVIQVCGPQTGEAGGNVVINVDADGLGPGGFGAAIFPTTTNVGGFDFIPAQDSRSIDSETGVAYDRNPASPTYGRLYLLYTEETVNENDDMEIMIRHSTDNGATWSSATRVNSDATTRSQFLPKLATDPATGNVVICWHDARNSATNTAMEVYCDRTTPGTYPTFIGNVAVSDGASTSNGDGVEFGDYSGLTLTGNVAHPVWADTSNSTGDNPEGTAGFDSYVDYLSVLAADYTLGVTPPSQAVCALTDPDPVYTVNIGAFGGYTDDVTLSASGHPAGTTTSFSVNPVTPAGSSTLTIGNLAGGTPGPATITVSASSTTGPKGVNVSLNLATAAAANTTLVAPADGATGVSTSAALSWTAVTGASYDVEVDDDVNFGSPDYSATVSGTSTTAAGLAADTTFFWRVRATNPCGGSFTAPRSFHTALVYCQTPNLAIPDAGGAVTSSMVIPPVAGATITDLDFYFRANHSWVGDIAVSLRHDTGAFQAHFNRPGVPGSTFGCDADGPDITLSDEAGAPVESACPAPFTGTFSPNVPLSVFDGQEIGGTWTIQAQDFAGSDIGTIQEWCLSPSLDDMPFLDGFETGNSQRWSFTAP